MTSLRNWINLLKIPSDNDANGIVIRILNHKFYLYPHTLRFIDPYIEVEYNLSSRQHNFLKLSNICLLNICIAFFHMVITRLNNETTHPDTSQLHPTRTDTIVVLFQVFVHLLIFSLIRFKRLAYSFNWIYVSLLCTCISIFIIEKNIIDFFVYSNFLSFDGSMSSIWTNTINYEIKMTLTNSFFYYGFTYQIFIANSITCLIYSHILSFIEIFFLIVYFLFLLSGFCMYSELCFDQYFRNDHVHKYLSTSNTKYPILFFMNANQTQYESFITTIKQNLPFPFTKSYADYESYLHEQVFVVVVYWVVFSCIVISITRYKDLNLRENFILKRVRSSKDDSRIHDASKHLNSIIKQHELSSDQGILENNINELGEVVLQTFTPIECENNTVISELINNAKQLVVENYTLSEGLHE